LRSTASVAKLNLGLVVARLGNRDRGERLQHEVLAEAAEGNNRRLASCAQLYLAVIATEHGDLRAAEAAVRQVIDELEKMERVHGCAILASVLLRRGSAREAEPWAEQAITLLDSGLQVEEGESLARVVWAECLFAGGRDRDARRVLSDAQMRLLARASRISRGIWRRSFLVRIPEHKRTLSLARREAAAQALVGTPRRTVRGAVLGSRRME
jgi:hypothetical protein